MRAFTLTLCAIGLAALLAGFSTPADTPSQSDQSPAVQLDQQAPQECSMPEEPEIQGKDTCRLCGSGSTGACSGAQQCRGTSQECRKKGCKDTGSGSCSTSANVKIC